MAGRRTVSLTSKLNVPTGAHILYFYSDSDQYFHNATSFVRKGIELGQVVLFLETTATFEAIRPQLIQECGERSVRTYLRHFDRDEFYRTYEDFHYERILENLEELLEPHLRQGQDLRLWGHVDWKNDLNGDLVSKLHEYECKADLALDELGYLTVCAYDAMKVPAAIQNELLKSHEYLMTDESLVHSNLYRHKRNTGLVFPTLSAQAELETEMDLYRQKLDFVHVVSHEVRNPLTVIKAYARLVGDNATLPRDLERLQAIVDYVDLIDNEISHIINTEEMLSSEALWHRRLIAPKPLLLEAIRMMEIKARTQNIAFVSVAALTGQETMLANAIGFKLIVSNLASNAIKYSDEGGKVECHARCEGGRLVVEVRDEGVGMSEEQVARLFRKYEKMNDERGGQGIGLFMVKKLADHFEGELEVESALGAGTTVTVSFPLRNR